MLQFGDIARTREFQCQDGNITRFCTKHLDAQVEASIRELVEEKYQDWTPARGRGSKSETCCLKKNNFTQDEFQLWQTMSVPPPLRKWCHSQEARMCSTQSTGFVINDDELVQKLHAWLLHLLSKEIKCLKFGHSNLNLCDSMIKLNYEPVSMPPSKCAGVSCLSGLSAAICGPSEDDKPAAMQHSDTVLFRFESPSDNPDRPYSKCINPNIVRIAFIKKSDTDILELSMRSGNVDRNMTEMLLQACRIKF